MAAVVVIVIIAAVRGMMGTFGGHRQRGAEASADEAALSATDLRDGLQSLCRVYQIYGIPTTGADADAAAKSAAELYKLGGNRTTARSEVILERIAHEFSDKRLTAQDCAAAGQPVHAISSDEGVGIAPGAVKDPAGATR